ncbi:MAG: TonB-dependent receptor [Ferruginibacter sp.]
MKYLITALCLLMNYSYAVAQTETRKADTTLMEPVEIKAIRAADKAPFAKTNISKAEIAKNNIGQDLPFLLNQTPSVVVNADAGNGIGYTGIRIRGTDASRINVTLNGIPYNDAESQGTFFVDLPDFASSVSSIQVQRGVGTSSNGAGAFGASINISTNELNEKKSIEFQNSAGSYHSFKNTLLIHSGLLGKHFTIDGRLSSIRSDGYIERASSRLQSFFTSAAYTDAKQSLRLNIFSGKEKTYQAWYGIDEKTLATNRRFNSAGTEKAGEPYDNETDNYTQTHYQLFYNRTLSSHWKTNMAVFLTRGLGYYEQYRADESLNSYGLPDYINGPDTITSTNLVRQLWLDNYFYGTVFSFQYDKAKTNLIFGGGLNQYDGKHYGKIVSADVPVAVPVNYRWYDLDAVKKDFSLYGKWTQKLTQRWQTFIDLQARLVDYRLNGFRNNPAIRIKTDYLFFNPKAGITYTSGKHQLYFSYAMANKEPNRDDFETGLAQVPKPEQLHDFEAGYEFKKTNYSWGVNLYYMRYKNQLVLNGKINDVGAYTRINIPNSFRAGIELTGAARFSTWMNARANVSFSRNRVKNFTEFIDDYDNGGQQTKIYNSSDIAFSPSVVGAATINFIPFKHAEISLISKYTGRQYLDNTSSNNRKLDPFYVQDIRLSYQLPMKKGKSVNFFVQGNNVFSEKYEPNGYTFSYIYGGALTTENFYFPMATFNLMAGLGIKL